MPGLLTWLVALVVLMFESAALAAFGLETFVFQTPVVLTLFLALRRDFVAGALVLAGLLVPIEWLAVGPSGYYSLGLVIVFFSLHLARGYIDSTWGVAQVLLAALAVGVQAAVMGLVISLLAPKSIGAETLVGGALDGALGAALIVWPLGALLDRLDALSSRRSESGVRLS